MWDAVAEFTLELERDCVCIHGSEDLDPPQRGEGREGEGEGERERERERKRVSD